MSSGRRKAYLKKAKEEIDRYKRLAQTNESRSKMARYISEEMILRYEQLRKAFVDLTGKDPELCLGDQPNCIPPWTDEKRQQLREVLNDIFRNGEG